MRKLVFGFLVTLFAFTISSQANDWQLVQSKSRLSFNIIADGNVISGEFKTFTADITLNPEDTIGANIKAVIEADSLKADDGSAAGTALGASWLFSKKFPHITYQSKSVTKLSEGEYEIDGVLSVKELSKPLKLPFTLKIVGNMATAIGKTVIDRTTFNIGEVGDAAPTIEIDLEIVATKK